MKNNQKLIEDYDKEIKFYEELLRITEIEKEKSIKKIKMMKKQLEMIRKMRKKNRILIHKLELIQKSFS